jgi:predicted negative regulator of RcsB-dependent stress response
MEKHLKPKLADQVQANAKYIVFTLVVAALAWGSYVAYGAYAQKREIKAQNDLFAIESEYEKKQEEISKVDTTPEVKKLKAGEKPTPPEPPKPPEKNPETLAKNFGSIVERYESFIKDNNGTKASMVAGISLADIYLDHKEPQKAAAVLEPLAKQTRQSDLFYGLLNSQLGIALSDSGKCEDAVKVFTGLLEAKAQEPFHSQSLLRQGACLVTLNKFDEAKAAFEKARTEYPNSYTGEMAQGYERLVELRKSTTPAPSETAAK